MNATTMPIGTPICELTEQGIKLSVKHGNLTVDAPKGKVTSNVLGVLKERKPEIIKELEGMDEEIQFGKTASLYRGPNCQTGYISKKPTVSIGNEAGFRYLAVTCIREFI